MLAKRTWILVATATGLELQTQLHGNRDMLRNGDHMWDPAPCRSRVLARVPCSRASSRSRLTHAQ
eukprot:6305619-Prymnesium_polylepis.1